MGTNEDRFAVKTRRDPSGCLVWTATKDSLGYGMFWFGQRMHRAYRVAWIMKNGPIPTGLSVDHLCHNPSCVEVAHLRLATHQQNMQNRAGAARSNRSGYRGVSVAGKDRFRATVGHNGKMIHLGYFTTAIEAAEAASAGRAKYHQRTDDVQDAEVVEDGQQA